MSKGKGSWKVAKIRQALEAIGADGVSAKIWWEPLGLDYEMCGRSGGWFINGEPVGYPVENVVQFIYKCPNYFNQLCTKEVDHVFASSSYGER